MMTYAIKIWKKKYFAIYEHDVFTVNIYFFMRISRVLCFFKHFLWFKLYKSDQFPFIISDFIDDDNEVKLLLNNIMHLWHWIFSISIIIFDYHYHKEVQVCTLVHRSARPHDHAPYVLVETRGHNISYVCIENVCTNNVFVCAVV
jgi:hypothetical protein